MVRAVTTILLIGFLAGCSVFDTEPSIDVQLHAPIFNAIPDTIRIGEGIRVRAELTDTRRGIIAYRFEMSHSNPSYNDTKALDLTTSLRGIVHHVTIDTVLDLSANLRGSDEAGVYTFGLIAQNGKDVSGKRALFYVVR
ncbi:MAG: hypothetical protein SH809_20140 [Rhodothermales bacterium]|nr:hypothetical protein [Rhodothermales bacterium]